MDWLFVCGLVMVSASTLTLVILAIWIMRSNK